MCHQQFLICQPWHHNCPVKKEQIGQHMCGKKSKLIKATLVYHRVMLEPIHVYGQNVLPHGNKAHP